MVIIQNHMSKNLSEIHMRLPLKFIFYFSASLDATFFFFFYYEGRREGELSCIHTLLPCFFAGLSVHRYSL